LPPSSAHIRVLHTKPQGVQEETPKATPRGSDRKDQGRLQQRLVPLLLDELGCVIVAREIEEYLPEV